MCKIDQLHLPGNYGMSNLVSDAIQGHIDCMTRRSMARVLILSDRIEFHQRLAAIGLRRFNMAGPLPGKGTMTNIEMNARAALYLGSDWHNAKQEGPRVFPTAAQAVRFAMEEAAPVSLRGARMVVGNQSFTGDAIADLYRSSTYPFRHKVTRKYRPSKTARRLKKLDS